MFYTKVKAHYRICSAKVNDLQHTYKAMTTVDEDIMKWSVKDIIKKVANYKDANPSEREFI